MSGFDRSHSTLFTILRQEFTSVNYQDAIGMLEVLVVIEHKSCHGNMGDFLHSRGNLPSVIMNTMVRRRHSKRVQQRELNIILVALIVIAVITGLGSSPQSRLLYLGIVSICFIGLGAAVYYYFVYQKQRQYQAGLRQLQIDDVDRMTGLEFEKYVADLFRRQGYLFETTSLSGDLGVDLIIIRDGLRTAVQTKRYSKPVNQAAIREAVAGMQYYKCTQSMVVTNNRFTKLAVQLANSNRCELVDREKLIEMIANLSSQISKS